jgi:amidase
MAKPISLKDYSTRDAHGLAQLIAKKQASPKELALTALKAIETVDQDINAVCEIYHDRIAKLNEKSLGDGPFRGVPFLIKDVFGHIKGRKIEYASRLCEGMICEADTYYYTQLVKAGVNVIGRTRTPEYSMAGTTEGAFYGNTSNPWKKGYSAGGSSGGAQAAVTAGIVPLAHGSDIGGSIRIPASYCGGVGLKPSRGRVSIGPVVDEGGLGFSTNMVQTMTVRDAAAMLDWVSVPQVGDPFIIPKPTQSYAALAKKAAPKLKIGLYLKPPLGVPVDKEVAAAVKATAKALENDGHTVIDVSPEYGGIDTVKALQGLFFFGFDVRLETYGSKTGKKPSPETLEPVMWSLYQYAKRLGPKDYFGALAAANTARRRFSQVFTKCDVVLSPTSARPAEAWNTINLSKPGATADNLVETLFAIPTGFTIPYNLTGTPAISLPLAMHSSGLPIGVQLAGKFAEEHVLLQLATMLEKAMPWAGRIPTMHASKHA